jgi:methylenetetrahydrofolate reductase (NADPH)
VVLHDALHAKQALVAEAGLRGSVTTQMCFDPARIREWLAGERAAGLTLPIELGLPGVVDRARLLSMGMRLGVGASLRYLRKNRATMGRMIGVGGYDPTELVSALAADATSLRITGLHSFTFNSVAPTASWQQAVLEAG